jgi:hypothetical protein
MTDVNPPPHLKIPKVFLEKKETRGYFQQIEFILFQLWKNWKTDLSSDNAEFHAPDNSLEENTYQTSVSSDYTITGDFDLEVVECTNTTPIIITMPNHYESARATIIRNGIGRVTINGNGTNILGLATQDLPMQYDAADLIGLSSEWGLT